MKLQNNFEKILDKALALKKGSASIEDITNQFPEFKKELIEILPLIDLFEVGKNRFKPKEAHLTKILEMLPKSKTVTNPNINRYNYQMGWKMIAPIGLILSLIAIIFYAKMSNNLPSSNIEPTQQMSRELPETVTDQNVEKTLDQVDSVVADDLDKIDQDLAELAQNNQSQDSIENDNLNNL